VFAVEGGANVCCSRDLYFPLCFVLASLDKASAWAFCPLGICSILTFSNPDCMTFQTRWVILEECGVFNLEFVI